MSEKYKIQDQEKIFFITFAVVHWVDVFTRRQYQDLVVKSLPYCQREKGLEIYAWCIMSNHLQHPRQDIIRDFKKYTSVALVRAIASNERESRKTWLLKIFKMAAASSNKHQKYRFWQNQYHPVELSDNDKQQRCLDYIHNNPVEAGMVREPEQYVYSSATDYSGGKGLLAVKFIE